MGRVEENLDLFVDSRHCGREKERPRGKERERDFMHLAALPPTDNIVQVAMFLPNYFSFLGIDQVRKGKEPKRIPP